MRVAADLLGTQATRSRTGGLRMRGSCGATTPIRTISCAGSPRRWLRAPVLRTRQRPAQPSLAKCKVAFHSSQADGESPGNLIELHAAEIAQFHDLRQSRVVVLQLLQGFVNGQEIDGPIPLADLDPFIDLDFVPGTALLRAADLTPCETE